MRLHPFVSAAIRITVRSKTISGDGMKLKYANSRALRPEDIALIEHVSKAARNIGFRPMPAEQAAKIQALRMQVESIRERSNANFSTEISGTCASTKTF